MYNQQVCHIQRSSKLLLPAKGCESWKSAHYCITAANAECLILSVTEKVGSAYSAQPNESHEHHPASVLQNSAKPGGGQPGLGSTQVPRQPLRPDLHRRSFSKYGTEAAGLVTRSATVLECLAFRPTTGLLPQHSPALYTSLWSPCWLQFCPLSALHSWLGTCPSASRRSGHKALYCQRHWLLLQSTCKHVS